MFRICLLFLCVTACPVVSRAAETLRHPASLGEQLLASDSSWLAGQAELRGDPRRGAIVFFKSAAACASCHVASADSPQLGPDLAQLARPIDAVQIVDAILRPSKKIDDAFQVWRFLTSDGNVVEGMIESQDADTLLVRPVSDLSNTVRLAVDSIEARRRAANSLMPDGLAGSLGEQRDFLDLVAYVNEVVKGGEKRAASLRPSDEALAVKDDSVGLDHAGILKRMRRRDFETGEKIYQSYCFNCHGRDGNTPSLPTARAFATEKLKFGSDPYRMFMTLTKGNGLMAPMSHLTPKERYQVVHYIREAFMRDQNPGYEPVDADYLAGLPKGTKDGTEIEVVRRDFGPALASQLERKYSSVLTVDLGPLTISYDLHSMDQAGLWKNGFLDLSETQHHRPRGEGTADPQGVSVEGLAGWRWGHAGEVDYPTELLLPRGPMPKHWMDYLGHYLFQDRVVLRYRIDGREIWELPTADDERTIRHRLRISPGKELLLVAADLGGKADATGSGETIHNAVVARAGGEQVVAAVVVGQQQLSGSLDSQGRIVFQIPASDQATDLEIVVTRSQSMDSIRPFIKALGEGNLQTSNREFDRMVSGGPLMWPTPIETTGYLGLERGAYKLDTLTIPESTPWKTWFRTSALDFFPDGRMVVTTYGGDVWIVSGIDKELRQLTWKRFAAGLYEPFGVKVVDGMIYVTCKDRLTRLHDQDGNGEADFYESFSADDDVSVNFHAFNFDLQTDAEGNFYYAKSGHGADTDLPGAVIKVSPDGESRSIYSTGFRTPNGMGALPDGRLTVSDNQGQWTPASKINLLKPGGYYGWVGNYALPGMWAPGGGTIDLEKVVPPESFDPPLVWMPQDFDNSSGGQVYAGDPRFGPLAGHLLHTSFGKGWMSYAMIQDMGDVAQAAIIKLPFDFRTGIMRARVNPADGQVYATGLQGWNGGGRAGLLENGIQRLRYTGEPIKLVKDCRVVKDGLEVQLNFVADRRSAENRSNHELTWWNYLRQKSYGSRMYSPSTGEPGVDPVPVGDVVLSEDGRRLKFVVEDLEPVDQVRIVLRLVGADGEPFEEEIYWTINRVPED
jgi:putative heme-binding domain-containing protein